ncbi:MAG TPA: hypothetical protein VN317_03630, partial [Candidatus Methanoperedens sp.]|nr:hypothetical protein [Candidatus Methanoperedens sp.]
VLTYGWEHREYHDALNIAEFTGATPAAHPLFFLLALLVPLAVLAARKVDAPLLLVTAGFFVFGVTYQRLTPDFAVLAVLVVAKQLPHLRVRARAWASMLALPAVALGAVLWCWNWDRNGTYRFGHGPLEEFFPAEAADFLDKEALPPNLYNNFETGGYLAFRLFPRYRVFQDGRIPAYPRDFMITPHQTRSGTSWASRLDKYDINSAVMAIRLLPNYFPGDQWAVVHWDDSFAVVVRRTRVEPRLLERLEYRYYKPLSPLGPPASAETARRTEDEIVRNLRGRRAPSWRVLLDLAHLKSLTARKQEAIAHITEAEKILPAGRKSQEMLAREWMFAGRWDLSAAAVERAKRYPEQRK